MSGITIRQVLAMTLLSGCAALASDEGASSEQVEAIFAKTSNGYHRTLRSDGTYDPETYTFGEGEHWGGEIADASIDRLTVEDIAKAVTPALAEQNYIRASSKSAAELYIVINWGTTIAPEHRTMDIAYERVGSAQQMRLGGAAHGASRAAADTSIMDGVTEGLEERELDGGGNTWNAGGMSPLSAITASAPATNKDTNSVLEGAGALQVENGMWATTSQQNAQMLGYSMFFDAEIQKYRYFVVLLAYENKTASGKRPKLLWEARLSISEHRNQFDKKLNAMLENAAPYLGQDSKGMVHKAIPEGFVHIGEIRSLEFPSESDAASVSQDGTHVAFFKAKHGTNGIEILAVDRPEGVLFAEIPSHTAPSRIRWSGAGQTRVTLQSGDGFVFNLNTKSWSPAVGTATGEDVSAPNLPSSLKEKLDDKFPHRTVSVLGTDGSQDRYLLNVSKAGAASRYYVFEKTSGLLVEVGRAERNQ